jgi:CHAT domain-containing protein/Tfp pilus assembly protein PilF
MAQMITSAAIKKSLPSIGLGYCRSCPSRVTSLARKQRRPSRQYLAVLYENLGDYARAEPLYQQALEIYEKAYGPEHPSVATTTNNLAALYERLGDYGRAVPLYQQALTIREEIYGSDHPSVATTLNSLATLYLHLREYSQAEPLYQRALAIREEIYGSDHPSVATTLNNLAWLSKKSGDYARAEPLYQQALEIYEKAYGPEHPSVATALNNLAWLYKKLGDYSRAEPLYLQALSIAVIRASPEILWKVQSGLSKVLAGQDNKGAAIFFGKQAVNTIQSLRARLVPLKEELQQSYLKEKEWVYKDLADLLIDQGRLAEAQQVLAMLKEEEYFDFVRRDAGRTEGRSTQTSFSKPETEWAHRFQEVNERLAAIGGELAELKMQKKDGLTPAQENRLEQLKRDAKLARQAFVASVGELKDAFAKMGGGRAIEFGKKDLDSLGALQGTLKRLGHGVVLVHYLVTRDRLRILVTTPHIQLHRDTLVSEVDLNQKIFAFRQTLLDPTKDPLPEAQALYRHLVTPIDEDLKQAKAQTLMISLDGTLRYIPLAALHDGEHYLIERYGLATFTPAAKLSLDWPPKPQWTAAGLGVSKASLGFKPLPAVQGELEGIIRRHGDDKDGVLPGVMHLDDEFTAERLAGALEEGYAVIHIASHFVFKPGTDLDSFLLLGKGARLSLAEIKEGDFSFHELDLLTLSACETAMGVEDANGREIESCGALAQNQGARGVLATLWAVADKSTGLFMQWFYRIREGEGATKAEALRQAQIVFIRGGSQTHYTHPYYWAPFILMGNWL